MIQILIFKHNTKNYEYLRLGNIGIVKPKTETNPKKSKCLDALL